jgi:hypothetical protein
LKQILAWLVPATVAWGVLAFGAVWRVTSLDGRFDTLDLKVTAIQSASRPW